MSASPTPMTGRSNYRSTEQLRRVSLEQIAAEIDRTPAHTLKLLRKTGFLGLRSRLGQGGSTYDASSLEVLKSLLSIPHRVIGDPADDWLSKYVNTGGKHG